MLTETRERFLLAILTQVPAERVTEIHFFSPIKQGGVESGVAVVVERGEIEGNAEIVPESESIAPDAMQEDVQEVVQEELAVMDHESEPALAAPDSAPPSPRYVVHTARYRLTLKGIDRGKWETSVFAEADAPLITVDAVVRGVQRRSGDVDDAVRMEGDEVRAFVDARAAAAGRAPAA
ncbi:MAG: hypothetical protein JWM41_1047 [Gemmatimonadetes bacterium]|nr:hypothetical protein [Gemmatimonadota bacterium]